MGKRSWARSSSALLLVLAGSLLVGCGGPYDATVTGMVTLDEAPVPQGVVSFAPQAAGALAYGQIDGQGRYEIWTGREQGLASGQYKVSVVATESTGDRGKNGGPPPLGKSITPDWYRDPSTSGLTFEVAPGENSIDLKLNKTPPPGWKPPRGR